MTIPAEIREPAGRLPTQRLISSFDGKVVTIVPAARRKKISRGARIVAHLRAHPGDVTMSTDEIMALTRGE